VPPEKLPILIVIGAASSDRVPGMNTARASNNRTTRFIVTPAVRPARERRARIDEQPRVVQLVGPHSGVVNAAANLRNHRIVSGIVRCGGDFSRSAT
jgi:hypothetical protein